MQIEDYKSNSHRSKMENKKIEKKKTQAIVNAKTKKKSKFNNIIRREDVDNIKHYAISDILIPSCIKIIDEIITTSKNIILYRDGKTSDRRTNVHRVSYNKMSPRDDISSYSRRINRRENVGFYADDIILESKSEVEDVIDALGDLIDSYKVASIADLYDIVNITSDHTDNNYGWTSIHGFDIVRDRDGWLLRSPKAKPIE